MNLAPHSCRPYASNTGSCLWATRRVALFITIATCFCMVFALSFSV